LLQIGEQAQKAVRDWLLQKFIVRCAQLSTNMVLQLRLK